MEDKAQYGDEELKFGQIPRSTRIELAYGLTGTTMGLLGECDALIEKVLSGKEVSGYRMCDYLDNVAKLTYVIKGMIYSETFDRAEVPF